MAYSAVAAAAAAAAAVAIVVVVVAVYGAFVWLVIFCAEKDQRSSFVGGCQCSVDSHLFTLLVAACLSRFAYFVGHLITSEKHSQLRRG